MKLCSSDNQYTTAYKTFMGSNPLRIRIDEMESFIKIYDGVRYLLLFGSRLYDAIYNKIGYLISGKIGITDSIIDSFSRTRIDSYNSFPIEKTLTFHNVIILIKSVVNKNENKYHYNVFFEKIIM